MAAREQTGTIEVKVGTAKYDLTESGVWVWLVETGNNIAGYGWLH